MSLRAHPAPGLGFGAVDHALDLDRGDRRKILVNRLATVLSLAVASVLLLALLAILGTVVVRGIGALTVTFFTQGAVDWDQGGALAAIIGSLMLVPLATLIAAPIGIGAGVLLAETRSGRFSSLVRTCTEILVGLPPIVVGIFVFMLMVAPVGHTSALAGVVAIAIIMTPLIARSVEEILRLVPGSLREASLALGIPEWRTIMSVVVKGAMGGILTAVMLALARGAGETASLMLTAYSGGQVINEFDMTSATDSLPTFIYYNAGQANDTLVAQAWGASLLLLVFVLLVNLLVRGRSIGRRAQ